MPTLLGPDGSVLAVNVRTAAGHRERMLGLVREPPLGPREALVLPRAAQIHTVGLRYAIDVAFCDRNGTVLHVVRSMKPGRVSRWVRGTHVAVEMGAGSLASIHCGETLDIRGL